MPRHASAIVATTSAYPPSTGKVDYQPDTNQPERKRRLESRDTPLNPPRSPGRRPGHVSTKSASAIPTLSTINIVPFAPSPLGSPTVTTSGTKTAASSRASSRRPSAASGRSVASQRSWLGKTTTATASNSMASPYETANQNQGGPLNGAADLLRQAMMSGTQRYADSLSLTRTSHFPCAFFCCIRNPCGNFTCCKLPHALHCTTPTTSAAFLRFFCSSAPRTATWARCPPQQRICRDSTPTTLGRAQNHRRSEGSLPFAP